MTSQAQHTKYGTTTVRVAPESSGTSRICTSRLAAFALMFTGLWMTVGAHVAAAKSLYVIAERLDADQQVFLMACDIAPSGVLTQQLKQAIPLYGAGAVGLALDSTSQRLFVSYMTSNVIVVLNAATLQSVGTVTVQGVNDMAGIVYDNDKRLLYCAARGTASLYAFQWKPSSDQLVPVPDSPFHLEGAKANGISLDEINGQLYVGNSTQSVNVYSTSDWHLVRTIAVSREATSVAIDPVRDYLYYGAGLLSNEFLVRHDLVDNTEKELRISAQVGVEDLAVGVVGLAVDLHTGFVFTSTGSATCYCGHDLISLHSDLTPICVIPGIGGLGNPGDIAVPDGAISYNPLRLTKTVKTSTGDQGTDPNLGQVIVGAELTYAICFDHNNVPLTNVSIVDTLPRELTFVGATGDGAYGRYDDSTHTYTWTNPPLVGGPQKCLELTCRMDPTAPAGQRVTNSVTISTRETSPTTTEVDVITAAAKNYRQLHVTKAVVAGATGGDAVTLASANPGDEVTYRISFDNRDNPYAVTNVRLTDVLPPQVTFVRATGDILFGRYDSATSTYTWSYPQLAAGGSNSVDLVVRVNSDAVGGATITNTATISSDNTSATKTSVGLAVGRSAPLSLQKTLSDGAVGKPDDKGRPCVDAGSTITYALTLSNPASGSTVTQVSVVDTLPREVTFIRSDDPNAGSYTPGINASAPMYTWRYASLAPGAKKTLHLTVRVNDKIDRGTVITNVARVTTAQGTSASASAQLDVVVGTVVQAQNIYIKPDHVYRNTSATNLSLMIVVHLPEGIGMGALSGTPMVLSPGNVSATGQLLFGTATQGKVLGFFDVGPILKATAGTPQEYGECPVTVTGQLNDGRSFIATGNIWILKFGGP